MNAVLPQPGSIEPETERRAQAARASASPAPARRAQPANGLVLGELIGLLDDGCSALVVRSDAEGLTSALRARSLVTLTRRELGRRVALMFEEGEPLAPIIVGVLHEAAAPANAVQADQVELSADGAVLTLSAREQLVLRCGAASITLTKAGKVLIQGAYVVSHATATNRIRGGTVQIN